ncbi:DHA2 family efflux MFS transporter permease subunit [Azospirillum sp. SYSU D00513]|uniref:DHA2 family efflux MFS transporter permease subunit n=1 Tax=Azospirillum sp. SYSU D00513 TaxID=2812561 RepID=UPI00200044E9|nr:DHA2 family efflux MFS transporter permease subunit [Azospirillum sp. SYSU D00513]
MTGSTLSGGHSDPARGVPPSPPGETAPASRSSFPPKDRDAAGAPSSPSGSSPSGPQAPGAPRVLTRRDWIGFFAMVVGMFMAILDIQIVASSLGEIQAGLSASADEISWVQTSYLIAEVVMIPLSGMLSRILSTRVLFAAAAAGFTLTSVACAFAGGIESMIVWRALQGFIGGAMIPTVFATSFALFPGKRQAGISVMIGLVATMAPTIGPTLGGWLTQTFSWHWLFLANVIPGVIVTSLVWTLVDVDKPNRALLKGFDILGLLLMAAFLGSLEFVVEEGPRQDWFDDEAVFAFAIVATLAGIGFFWRVLTYRNPIVELRAFLNRNFAIGSLYSFIIGVGLYGAVYLQPLFLARVRGYNSLQIGTVMFVTGIFQFLSAPLAGMLSKKLDLRIMLAMGLMLFGAGVWLNSFLTAQSSFWELFLPQAVRGVSLMFCFIPVNAIALGTLPPDQIKNASGLYNLMRNLGGAIGLAVINTVMTERLALHMNRLGDNLNLARPEVQSMLDGLTTSFDGRVADAEAAALRVMAGLVQREATVMTFNDCLLIMAFVFFGALLFMPLLRRPSHGVKADH